MSTDRHSERRSPMSPDTKKGPADRLEAGARLQGERPVPMREGDVFLFAYSEAARRKARTDLHWCFDGQVVVRDGRLCDTYWGFGTGEPRIVRPDEGALSFVCNLGDVREIKEYEVRHYDESDVFNLTHHHGHLKLFMVKKDATVSVERMLIEIGKREQAVRQELESATRTALSESQRLGELRARIEAGDLSRKPWW